MKEDFDITARALFHSLLERSFEQIASEDESQNVYYEPPLGGIEASELPLFEEEDREILMHRDAHFGNNFTVMVEHYEDEGIGAVLDIDPSRIEALMQLEKSLGHNLAPYLLKGADAEKIGQASRMYKALREQIENKKNAPLVAAISELILSEEDADIVAKKAASYGQKLVPYLLELIKTPVLYDPLFPGYGTSPLRACLALGKLKAVEAIEPLFQIIGTENFDTESAAIQALTMIGEPAIQFCKQQLASRPLTKNNERAAILASSLPADEALIEALISELEDPAVQKIENLAAYLVLACSTIPDRLMQRFKNLIPHMPDSVQDEMRRFLKSY